MATNTITYSGGSFNPTESAIADTKFTSTATNTWTVQDSTTGGTISGIGIGAQTSNTAINLSFTSKTATTLDNSVVSTGSANDSLVLGTSKGSQYFTGAGDNTVRFAFGSDGNTITTGDVDTFASGKDTIIFGGYVKDTTVQLAIDNQVDTIRIQSATTPVSGLKITGATNIDVLFIGSTKYNYNENSNLWVNSTNPGDTKNFS